MLRFTAKDIDGAQIELNDPLKVIINIDENAPADDLTVTFPLIEQMPELKSITVTDNGKIVFSGPVDEQQSFIGSDGSYTRIIARSMAANLLDNESKPVSYTKPSASVIFRRHLLNNGIYSYKGGDIVMKGGLNIPKGTTDWQAFASFCLATVGVVPRIEPDGTADFYGVENDMKLRFSNTDGTSYISVKENNLRCKLISDVYVRLNDIDGYTVDIDDDDAKLRGIKRRRYLDASGTTSPMVGDKIIKNARKNSYEVTVVTTKPLLDALGASAEVDCGLKLKDGLYVSSIYYSLSPDGEYTSLKLRRSQRYP